MNNKYKLTKKAIGVLIVMFAVLTGTIGFYFYRGREKTYLVAIVLRGQRKDFDRLHEIVLRKQIDELSRDLARVRFELKFYSNEGEALKSKQIYEEISADRRIVAVIDNTWGKELQAAAGIIRERRIPVISINADRQGIDFQNNTVFLGADDHVPESIVNFAKKILGVKTTIFITEESYAATAVFEKEFDELGLKPVRLGVPNEKTSPEVWLRLKNELDAQLKMLLKSGKDPCLVLNVHAGWGVEIINHIDQNYRGITILGGSYVINWSNSSQFGQNDRGNKLILLTNPVDAVMTEVYGDLLEISRGKDAAAAAMPQAQLYVKRCLDAVSVIRSAVLFAADDRKIDSVGAVPPPLLLETQRGGISHLTRNNFLEFFKRRLKSKSFAGKNDLYTFDENLVLLDQRLFEMTFRGESISYPVQLNSRSEIIPNVFFGLKIINISNIDIQNRTFHADFLYWLKYDKSYPNIKDYIHFRNERSKSEQEIPVDRKADDPIYYKQFKVSADFSFDVDFRKYPLDAQTLKIELEIINPADKLLISFDHRGIEESRKRLTGLFLNEWQMENFFVTVDNLIPASFPSSIMETEGSKLSEGDMLPRSAVSPSIYYVKRSPEMNEADAGEQKFKVLNIRVMISRRPAGPLVQIILPLISMALAAIGLLYVKNNSFSNIGEVSVGLFLSVVTYSIGFAQTTPRTSVLTAADLLFYATFLIVLLVFLKVIYFNSRMASHFLPGRDDEKSARIGNLFLMLYICAVAGIAFWVL